MRALQQRRQQLYHRVGEKQERRLEEVRQAQGRGWQAGEEAEALGGGMQPQPQHAQQEGPQEEPQLRQQEAEDEMRDLSWLRRALQEEDEHEAGAASAPKLPRGMGPAALRQRASAAHRAAAAAARHARQAAVALSNAADAATAATHEAQRAAAAAARAQAAVERQAGEEAARAAAEASAAEVAGSAAEREAAVASAQSVIAQHDAHRQAAQAAAGGASTFPAASAVAAAAMSSAGSGGGLCSSGSSRWGQAAQEHWPPGQALEACAARCHSSSSSSKLGVAFELQASPGARGAAVLDLRCMLTLRLLL